MRCILLSVVLIGLTLVSFGCHRQKVPADLPKLYPTTVTVVQDNKPLEGAVVIFFGSDAANMKWGVAGATDASGNAVMAVNGMYPGAPVGKFQATVSKSVTEGNAKIPPSPDPEKEPEAFDAWRLKYVDAPVMNKEFTLVELKYTQLEKTPFAGEVTAAGPNRFTFDVGKAVRSEVKNDR